MTLIRRTFLGGKQNLDADERLLKDGEYRKASNIRIANSEGSDVGAIEKSKSNSLVSSVSIGNEVSTIGTYSDEFSEKIYRLLKSENGCYLIEFDVNTEVTEFVLTDTRPIGERVLDLNENYLITGIDLIIDSDNNNRLLVFTDNYTQPKCVNIDRSKQYGENGFEEEDIFLIKKPPVFSPTIVLNENTQDEENNIEEKFLRFAYRFKYLDNEYSALSPFSDLAFKPKRFFYNYATGENESMVNDYSRAYVQFNTGSKRVTDIQLVFKESKSSTVYAIETYNKVIEGWEHEEEQSILFSNNKIFKVLSEKELNRLYDNVPLLAKSQAIINNQIVFGNYTENYNLIDKYGYDIKVQLKANLIENNIENLEGVRSLKSNRDVETAVVYVDCFGRMTTPLTSNYNTIHIPSSNSNKQNLLQLEINHKAPSFAKFYRVFVKQTRDTYECIAPSLFYEDGGYRWVKLEDADKDKVREGDILIVKSDSQGVLNQAVEVKVLEVTHQDKNFLQPEDVTDEIKELSGLYFKIKPKNFRLNIGDFETFEIDTYHNARKKYQNCIRNSVSEVGPAHFYGDTLNDLTTGGNYTGTSNKDTRFLVEIDGASSPNTFRWSIDNGSNWIAEGVTITGAAQNLQEGVTITFGATTGHSLNDEWNFNATSALRSSNQRAYGFFRTIGGLNDKMTESNHTIDDETIEGGARITLDYDEYNVGSVEFLVETISSSKYDNIQEWFYKENIGNEISKQYPTFDLTRIYFMRGVLGKDGDGSANTLTYDATDGYMTMVVESQNEQTATKWVKVRTSTTLFQFDGETSIVFETKPKDLNTDIYYEVGRTYEIDADGNHLGFDENDTNQTTSNKAILNLDVFNCFAWGNGFESYKIKDLFNENSFDFDTRPLTTIDNYRQNKRISSFTWSKPFEQSTNYNGLNEFNLSLINFYDLDDSYGSVQKMVSYDTNIDVWQEDKVHRLLFQKSIMYNQDGTSNISKSDEEIGGVIPYSGEFGISKNPESLSKYGNYVYWADKNRGVVLRKGQSGIEIISNFGMKDWFRDLFKNQYLKILGGYDPYFSQYIINIREVIQESLDEFTVTKVIVNSPSAEGLTVSSNYKWIENTTNSDYSKETTTLNSEELQLNESSTGEQGKTVYPKNNSLVVVESFKGEVETIESDVKLGYLISDTEYLDHNDILNNVTYLTNLKKNVNNGVLTYNSFDFNRTTEKYLYLVWDYSTIFISTAISELVQKDDCGVGYTGSDVVYSIHSSAFTSEISQEDADTQAQTYFDANKQAYANLNGDCIADTPIGTAFLELSSTPPDINNNGIFLLINGQPNEEITLQFALTYIAIDGTITFNSTGLVVGPLTKSQPIQIGTATLDAKGRLTVPYSINTGVSCRIDVVNRSSELQLPFLMTVIDNLEDYEPGDDFTKPEEI